MKQELAPGEMGKCKKGRIIAITPAIAEGIDVCDAFIIQQIHYWIYKNPHLRDGHKWVYNTYENWAKQIQAYDTQTIRKKITELEKEGVIISANYNKFRYDRTKLYRLDYEKLCATLASKITDCVFTPNPNGEKTPIHVVENISPIPENNTKKNTKNNIASSNDMQWGESQYQDQEQPGEESMKIGMKGFNPKPASDVVAAICGKPVKYLPHERLIDIWREYAPDCCRRPKIDPVIEVMTTQN